MAGPERTAAVACVQLDGRIEWAPAIHLAPARAPFNESVADNTHNAADSAARNAHTHNRRLVICCDLFCFFFLLGGGHITESIGLDRIDEYVACNTKFRTQSGDENAIVSFSSRRFVVFVVVLVAVAPADPAIDSVDPQRI